MIKVKRLTETAKLPTKAHKTDLGYDLYYDGDAFFMFREQVYTLETGICVGFPEGYGGIIKDRSSMASRGIFTHGGVIDEGYTGHIKLLMTYVSEPTDAAYQVISRGDKIAQLVLIPTTNFEILETDSLDGERGEKGFGSSGN